MSDSDIVESGIRRAVLWRHPGFSQEEIRQEAWLSLLLLKNGEFRESVLIRGIADHLVQLFVAKAESVSLQTGSLQLCLICGRGITSSSPWRGLCDTCKTRVYHSLSPRFTKECPDHCAHCGRLCRVHGRGLCRTCYISDWRGRNLEYSRKYSRKYYMDHKREVSERAYGYYHRDIEQSRSKDQNRQNARRAQKSKAQSPLTHAQWCQLKKVYDSCCAYCGCFSDRLTQDHIVPLSLGGNHSIDNVVPACRSCNSRKHTQVWTPNPPKVAL